MPDARLLYGYDPLCGWCYVFRPSIDAVAEALPDLEIDLVMGGLVVGPRAQPMRRARDYLVGAMATAEARSGVRFGDAFRNGLLLEDDYTMDSVTTCRAVVSARALGDARTAFAFAEAYSHAIYHDGRKPDAPETLRALAHDVGLDGDALVAHWSSPAAERATAEAFHHARSLGVDSYPTLLRSDPDGALTVVQRGFDGPEPTLDRVRRSFAR